MKKIYTIILGMACTQALSCQKTEVPGPDTSDVRIEFIRPQEGASFRKGDTVVIEADVSYESQLHGYELRLLNETAGSVLFTKEEHLHTDKIRIRQVWIDTLSGAADLKLRLQVATDHTAEAVKKEVSFKTVP